MSLWHDPIWVAIICASALGIAYALNHVFAPRSGAVALTIMLIMLWCAEWGIWFLPSPPDPTWLLAGLDLIGFLATVSCWKQARRAWKEALAFAFVAAMLVQVVRGVALVFDATKYGPHTVGSDTFTAARNVLFFAKVVCCGWTGGSRVCAWLLSRLPGHSPVDHRVGARK